MRDTTTLAEIAALADPLRRRDGGRSLARRLGADDLIVFIPDPELGTLLPAPGFPRTLPGGRQWRAFLARCVADGRHAAEVPSPPSGETAAAMGVAGGGCVLVLLGGTPRPEAVTEVAVLLPLLAAAFRAEHEARVAEGHAATARRSAAESRALAETLDTTRRELQRALGEAEAANRAKDEFLSVLSHELRTPLTPILGFTGLLRRSPDLDPAMLAHALDTIDRSARTQARLVEDLLDVSRIVTGKLRLDIQPADVILAVDAALAVVRPQAEEKEVMLAADLDAGAGVVDGDPARLQQVVWNLLANAIKFTPAGGRVSVRLTREGSSARLSVSDTGIGIAPDFLPYVFDRFRQANSTSMRAHGGLGLGLAIVRHVVERHGGTVSVASAGEGLGATFTVRLPLAGIRDDLPDTAMMDAAAAPRPPALTGVRVLLVEDQDDTRALVVALLEAEGAVVRAASSGREALAALDAWPPQVLIADIGIPDEDGYNLIARVRERPAERGGGVPAAALTAYAGDADRRRAADAGFQEHLAKPFEAGELVACVSRLLRDVPCRDENGRVPD